MRLEGLRKTVQAGEDVVVPKTDSVVIPFGKPRVSRTAGIFGLLAAGEFDAQPHVRPVKIDDGAAKRHLPLELRAMQPAIPNGMPKFMVRIGHILPTRTGMRTDPSHHCSCLLPLPLSTREGRGGGSL